ncbi:hypothetical protein Ae406Ps2_3504 [Pseudonocardia sp. Ae406_Ps2]|nr:hypothetical protein Ae406Ps2_3504 [Pseudonocardia sp. Ae406_Ps2]
MRERWTVTDRPRAGRGCDAAVARTPGVRPRRAGRVIGSLRFVEPAGWGAPATATASEGERAAVR